MYVLKMLLALSQGFCMDYENSKEKEPVSFQNYISLEELDR
jgi:hypothetical protein